MSRSEQEASVQSLRCAHIYVTGSPETHSGHTVHAGRDTQRVLYGKPIISYKLPGHLRHGHSKRAHLTGLDFIKATGQASCPISSGEVFLLIDMSLFPTRGQLHLQTLACEPDNVTQSRETFV